MSAKLERALERKKVLVRKRAAGECVVHFKSKDIKDVVLSHMGVLDLMSKRGVTAEAVRNSNLKELLQRKIVEIV